MNDNHLSDVRYADLPIDPTILQSLDEIGFEFCTPVQAETLKYSLEGKDVTGQAQTGTGKTAAFLVAVLQRLLSTQTDEGTKPGNIGCLILAPTRELAIQIADDAKKMSKHTGLKTALVYGGTAYEKQKRQFEQPVDILVGTPGRIIDYFKQKCFTLRHAQGLVLDEADRMFDLGFINDIRFLLRRLPTPSKRLNMLFSATLSQRVLELAYDHMDNPEKVEIKAESVSAKNVSQKVYYPANSEKIPLLIGILQKEQPFRSIVFVNTKRNAEKIDDFLRGNKISAAMISGDVKQNKRQRLLEEFEKGKHSVLIATDVAARGLHISDVSHVINFDLPQHQEDYVHRIGRTARAGASGDSISFACEDTAFYLPEIEEYIGMSIPVEGISSELLPEIKRPVRVQRDRVNGHDKNDKRKNGGNRGGQAKGKRSSNGNKRRNTSKSNKPNNNHQRRRNPTPQKPSNPESAE
ncbi:MAG: ATP-dependent RNA helicase RhlB [uncultured Thiotrichaceae bacterium]|uniref:ATP-dependent RNA helicase RhlB n=1 Tax=uncultured Thiotrichaceae bacterium TaxID=298394 RepID=A0A6S6UGM2_9GAMM|nr:MAG: ATP-dependent RNA helicase RhlB [uncultured Thiotrichaceae bacterium]